MQNTRKLFGLNSIIALIIFTALSLTGCDNGTTPSPAHVHQWGEWTVTTAPTYMTEGVETRICILDATHTETRAISRIPFTNVANLGTWLTSQTANAAETAYKIALKIDDENDFATLKTTLNSATDKYVYIDFSGRTVTTIPNNAFYGCATLTGITIPDSLTNIGAGPFVAFRDCINLTAIIVAADNSAYTTENGILYNKDKTSLRIYPAGKTTIYFVIPNSVTTITSYAFSSCASLASVTFQGVVSGIFPANATENLGDLRAKFYATDPTNGTPGTYTTTAPVDNSSVGVDKTVVVVTAN